MVFSLGQVRPTRRCESERSKVCPRMNQIGGTDCPEIAQSRALLRERDDPDAATSLPPPAIGIDVRPSDEAICAHGGSQRG